MHEPTGPGAQDDLFSVEADSPKRENPYLRGNRQKEKAARAPHPPRRREDKPSADDEKTPRHRSNFFFEHVKLIVAILTMVVILALVLITDVVGIVEKLLTEHEQEGRETITLTYVVGLSERGDPIIWADLEPFRRHETDAKDSITWSLDVEGTPYRIMISGVSTKKPPVYVRLYDMQSGDHVKLDKENLSDFLDRHPPK